MMGGNHSKRDHAPQWLVNLVFTVIACGLLWAAVVMLFL